MLRPLGFWRMSAIVATIWMLWHLPLHVTYLIQGTLSGAEVVATTLGVAAWAPLLTPTSAESSLTFWVVTSASWALMITAALILRATASHQSLPINSGAVLRASVSQNQSLS